ncbi:MAG: diiron oxygenase, partial [Actinomycetota bacterium]|nr:diiron oxygenase [Actinomycetota bacterium]
MTGSTLNPTREEFSERLLKGSVKKSYAPIVDIDWDAPLDPDKFFLPPRTVSLYGTPLWQSMSREQRIELSRQELVNT